ncbi:MULTISPECIES: DNA sulfur modification protein DndB [unclassified Mycobacterium]|uniref:DNA sulfur modification protein DndB n=1 Tax=unclassified Mycobacterium TaxID=2642494 RepID=UPI0008020679|nr:MULTISPECIES: DNA sulfur modification protein DndB [unclassified Mycobacterium]OBG58892.1 hypothetical protein A5703_03040 [Mycobacterium sp. E188]OBH37269.1 hypothetical protein A5691_26940 [Mycobacterium sp. E183]
MGELTGISAVLPLVDLMTLNVDQIMKRKDYELEGVEPGNRAISETHVKKIKDGLRRHADKLLTGTFILAIDPDGMDIDPITSVTDDIDIVQWSILSGYPLWVLDAQHRNDAVRRLWKETFEAVEEGDMDAEEVARLLKKSAIPVLIVLEGRRNEIARMFVNMASTRPISPSLVSVMDRESFANRLGLEVARRAQLLTSTERADRLEFQGSIATGETLYAAAAIRGAAANIFIGYKDRSPDMREQNLRQHFGVPADVDNENIGAEEQEAIDNGAAEAVDYLDYAYQRLPGWRDLKRGKLEPKEFRAQFVHGTPSGFYVITGVICAARMSTGVDVKHVIDLMAEHIHWLRNERVKESEDSPRLRHPDFEGTLVVNEPVFDQAGEIIDWKTRTGGGARTNYEKAARSVIDRLIEVDPSLAGMRSDEVLVSMGLKAGGRRGRPPKGS